MKKLFYFTLLLMILTSCETKTDSKEISSVNDLSQVDFTDENNVLLDVRTPEEFNEGNIPNSVNLDFNSGEFDSMILDLDKEKTYYLYCKSGNRSSKAAAKMQEAGFKNVVNLQDGYSAYKK